MVASLAAACSGTGASSANPASNSAESSSAASSVSDQYYNLSIGTASATGTYYPIGAAISELVPRYDNHLFVTAQVSGGSVENIKLVSQKDVDIGFANQMHFALAKKGAPPFNSRWTTAVR
jgi:TRAP-type uncharacterized transport system substrate-binding protein